MKNLYFSFISILQNKLLVCFLILVFSKVLYTQNNFFAAWSNIENELVKWDSVRGKWITESIQAIADHQISPTRKFSEDYTPFELLKMVPAETLNRINVEIERTEQPGQNAENRILLIKSMLQKLHCRVLLGRSYGDPHISTFDKSNYSFQTVGEFTLMNLNNGYIEVQCRQKPQNENFSFNTAVAISIAGDKIGLYAADGPESEAALRVNGVAYAMGSSFTLPHGGNVRFQADKYIFSAPTGEVITAEIKNWRGSFGFINLNVQLFSCDKAQIKGLLGNANGNTDDDFISTSRTPATTYSALFGNSLLSKVGVQAERQYLTFLANEFADKWRVSNENSLFEYQPGKNTLSYTDRTFPRAHLTLNDLTTTQQSQARKKCEENGVAEEDLRGCIFDQGFLNLDPSPRAPVPDFTKGATLGRLEIPSGKNSISESPLLNNMVKPDQIISPKNKKPGNQPIKIFQKNKIIPQSKSTSGNKTSAPAIKINPGAPLFKNTKGK